MAQEQCRIRCAADHCLGAGQQESPAARCRYRPTAASVPRSAAVSPSIAASASRGAATSRVRGALASSVQRSPRAVTGTIPARISRLTESPPREAIANDVRCPEASDGRRMASRTMGVKIRTRARLRRVDGQDERRLERLNCSASACIVVSSRLPASLEHRERIAAQSVLSGEHIHEFETGNRSSSLHHRRPGVVACGKHIARPARQSPPREASRNGERGARTRGREMPGHRASI